MNNDERVVIIFQEERDGYWTKWTAGNEEMAYATLDLWMEQFGLTRVYNVTVIPRELYKTKYESLFKTT